MGQLDDGEHPDERGKIVRQFTPPEPRYFAGIRRAGHAAPRNRTVYKLRSGRVFLLPAPRGRNRQANELHRLAAGIKLNVPRYALPSLNDLRPLLGSAGFLSMRRRRSSEGFGKSD